MTVVVLSPDMTPKQFKAWLVRLREIDPSLSNGKLAKRLKVDQPRIGKWERGEIAISGYLHLALERLEQILIEERKLKRNRRARTSSAAPGREGE